MVNFSSALLAASLATNVIATPNASTKKACNEISRATPQRVSTPLALSYIGEVQSYWSTKLRDVKPACLVLPQSTDEVAAVVKVLNRYPDVQFAVKSGGHDPNERHSSVQDGVLISMRDLAGVTYDEKTQLAYVKPGGEWNDVSGPLDEQGVAIVGGRLGKCSVTRRCLLSLTKRAGLVGVGGYLLQGGISFLSSQYGLAADVSCE